MSQASWWFFCPERQPWHTGVRGRFQKHSERCCKGLNRKCLHFTLLSPTVKQIRATKPASHTVSWYIAKCAVAPPVTCVHVMLTALLNSPKSTALGSPRLSGCVTSTRASTLCINSYRLLAWWLCLRWPKFSCRCKHPGLSFRVGSRSVIRLKCRELRSFPVTLSEVDPREWMSYRKSLGDETEDIHGNVRWCD